MSDFNLPNSGNYMVEEENRRFPLDPDDYLTCDECGEQTHIDYIITADKPEPQKGELDICVWCFQKRENEFHCRDCDALFVVKGIPARCPHCDSFRIEYEYPGVRVLIEEKQRELLNAMEVEPSHTAKILSLYESAFINKQRA